MKIPIIQAQQIQFAAGFCLLFASLDCDVYLLLTLHLCRLRVIPCHSMPYSIVFSFFPSKQSSAIFAEIKISLCCRAATDEENCDASTNKQQIVMLCYCHKLIAVDSLFRSCRSLHFLLWLISCEWTCFTFSLATTLNPHIQQSTLYK